MKKLSILSPLQDCQSSNGVLQHSTYSGNPELALLYRLLRVIFASSQITLLEVILLIKIEQKGAGRSRKERQMVRNLSFSLVYAEFSFYWDDLRYRSKAGNGN